MAAFEVLVPGIFAQDGTVAVDMGVKGLVCILLFSGVTNWSDTRKATFECIAAILEVAGASVASVQKAHNSLASSNNDGVYISTGGSTVQMGVGMAGRMDDGLVGRTADGTAGRMDDGTAGRMDDGTARRMDGWRMDGWRMADGAAHGDPLHNPAGMKIESKCDTRSGMEYTGPQVVAEPKANGGSKGWSLIPVLIWTMFVGCMYGMVAHLNRYRRGNYICVGWEFRDVRIEILRVKFNVTLEFDLGVINSKWKIGYKDRWCMCNGIMEIPEKVQDLWYKVIDQIFLKARKIRRSFKKPQTFKPPDKTGQRAYTYMLYSEDPNDCPRFSGEQKDWLEWKRRVKVWRRSANTCESKKACILVQCIKGGEAAICVEGLDEDLLCAVDEMWAHYVRGWTPDQKKVYPFIMSNGSGVYGVDYVMEELEKLYVKSELHAEFSLWTDFWMFEPSKEMNGVSIIAEMDKLRARLGRWLDVNSNATWASQTTDSAGTTWDSVRLISTMVVVIDLSMPWLFGVTKIRFNDD